MARLDDFRSLVLQSTDIVSVISQSVALKKRGKNYVGLCPFHSEKTPSFNVSQDKQFFICFGCKKSGNAIDFVMERDRLEFKDALKQLGEAAGLEMPAYGVSKEQTSRRQLLIEAHSAAASFFRSQLSSGPLAAAAKDYLTKRGFTPETLHLFGVGASGSGWDGLLRSREVSKFPPDILHEAGLLKARISDENRSGGGGGGGYYDTFRNRIMFPIRDEGGRTIAFGGRVMPGSEDPAKYLNSPETPLFSKSRCVFGLDLAREEVSRTGMVAIVEGYTDVMMAHQFGVKQVVSVLGTAMTEQHLGILRRFAKRVVLLFDADTAGDVAVERTLQLFIAQPIEMCVATLPQGLDPDEFLLKFGAEEFRKILDHAPDALDFLWRSLAKGLEQSGDLTSQQNAITKYLDLLAKARAGVDGPTDDIRWGAILSRVQKLTGLPIDILQKRLVSTKTFSKFQKRTPTSAKLDDRPSTIASTPPSSNSYSISLASDSNLTHPAAGHDGPPYLSPDSQSKDLTEAQSRSERWILGILLLYPRTWGKLQREIGPQDFTEGKYRHLADLIWSHYHHEGITQFADFLSLSKDSVVNELSVLLVEEAETLHDVKIALADALGHFDKVRRRREEAELVRQSREATSTSGAGEPGMQGREVELLRQLTERVRHPDSLRSFRK